MKVSEYIIDFFVKQGIRHIFEMPGGAITHLLDAIYQNSAVECVSLHHEQAAAFAAEAYARLNGKLGVAMATSGPGALNLLTGIGSCYFDSVPCIFLTGQVNTYEYKFDKPVRQLGFQETDIVNIVKPITKNAEIILDPKRIRYHLEKAVYIAQSGRPGPVLLDIPLNIQGSEVNVEELSGFYDSEDYQRITEKQKASLNITNNVIDNVIKLLEKSFRPLILAGGGIRAANGWKELLQLVELTGIPVVTSMMGLDSIPHDHPAFLGMIGSYGNRYSNLAVANCDLLLILGSRLDTRQTGTRPDTFARAAKKIHVDIDPNELNHELKVDLPINGDLKDFLNKLNSSLGYLPKQDLTKWYDVINNYKNLFPSSVPPKQKGRINPNLFLKRLSKYFQDNDVVCIDVGQNQMWASQSLLIKQGQRLLASGGMGAMGFALPAAIGAAKALTTGQIFVIAGDGGMQVNIQELDTLSSHKLPIKIFVLNNRNLGMVRVFQELYFEGRLQSTVKGYSSPDFRRLAQAYNIPAFSLKNEKDCEKILTSALEITGPVLVDVELEQNTVVIPKLLVNKPIEDMFPQLTREKLKQLMLIDLLEEGCDKN